MEHGYEVPAANRGGGHVTDGTVLFVRFSCGTDNILIDII